MPLSQEAPAAANSALIIPTVIPVTGNSVGAGTHLRTPATDRFTARLAKAFGTTENNNAVSGSGFLTDNQKAYGELAEGGNFLSLSTLLGGSSFATHTSAPYLSPFHLIVLVTGGNDVPQFGPPSENDFLTIWNNQITAACAYARAGCVIQPGDSRITTTGSGWDQSTNADGVIGNEKFYSNSSAGGTIVHTVASDYDGQAIDFLVGYQQANGSSLSSRASATWTITKSGTNIGSIALDPLSQGLNASYGMFLNAVIRIPTPTPSEWQGVTLVATPTSIVNNAFFEAIIYESNPAPYVLLADIITPPTGWTSLFGAFPYNATAGLGPSDFAAVNAENVTIASQFSDGRVIADGADSVYGSVDGAPTGYTFSYYAHPDQLGCGLIAEYDRAQIQKLMTWSDISILGTSSTGQNDTPVLAA